MARVDRHVVENALMDKRSLGFSQSCDTIWSQCLPRSCNLAVALDADPKHSQSVKGLSQPFLATSAIKKYIVNNDAGPVVSDRRNADIPRRFKGPPTGTDLDLPRLADVEQGSIFDPLVGHRPNQIIDAE